VPAAAVIPAPIAYINVVAVKKLVVGFWACLVGHVVRRVVLGGFSPLFFSFFFLFFLFREKGRDERGEERDSERASPLTGLAFLSFIQGSFFLFFLLFLKKRGRGGGNDNKKLWVEDIIFS